MNATVKTIALACSLAFISAVHAQEKPPAHMEQLPKGADGGAATRADIKVSESKEYGRFLTDAKGRPLYLLEGDQQERSKCRDECAKTWPPLGASGSNPKAADAAIDENRLGTIKRPDGSTQVTYDGHPLYYYEKDRGTGKPAGQGVRDTWGEWYLVTPSGRKLEKKG